MLEIAWNKLEPQSWRHTSNIEQATDYQHDFHALEGGAQRGKYGEGLQT